MTLFNETILRAVTIGIGATAVMDLWLLLLKSLGVPTLNFALLGRWVGHMPQGQWGHTAIAQASPVRGEKALGWAVHYATGLAFAALLVGLVGLEWLRTPTLAPAPLFVMQPAIGAGVASSRTKTPILNCIKSLGNHTVFGLGLYIATRSISSSAWA
jgi:hypothetical protein